MARYVSGANHGNYKHGLRKTKTFGVWWQMIQRCRNPKHAAFKDYGGRGISVCERWKSFVGFLADMGHAPAGLSLDRIDNDGNYEPGNCRWATRQVQQRNKRSSKLNYDQAYNIRIEIENGGGLTTLGREFGVSPSVIAAIRNGRAWRDAKDAADADIAEILRCEDDGALYCMPEECALLGHA